MTQPRRERVRLDLGTGSRVSIPVAHRSRHSITLSQPLPFLRLHNQLTDEEGRPATLVGVSVVVRNDTPHLVLDLTYPEMAAAMTAAPGCPAPIPPPSTQPPIATADRHDTSPYMRRPAPASREVVVGPPPLEPAAAQRVAALRGPRPGSNPAPRRERFVRTTPSTPSLGPLRRSPWQRAWAWICF